MLDDSRRQHPVPLIQYHDDNDTDIYEQHNTKLPRLDRKMMCSSDTFLALCLVIMMNIHVMLYFNIKLTQIGQLASVISPHTTRTNLVDSHKRHTHGNSAQPSCPPLETKC